MCRMARPHERNKTDGEMKRVRSKGETSRNHEAMYRTRIAVVDGSAGGFKP